MDHPTVVSVDRWFLHRGAIVSSAATHFEVLGPLLAVVAVKEHFLVQRTTRGPIIFVYS